MNDISCQEELINRTVGTKLVTPTKENQTPGQNKLSGRFLNNTIYRLIGPVNPLVGD